MWECNCSCGRPEPHFVKTNRLNNGTVKSCGCLKQSCHTIITGQVFARLTTLSYQGAGKWLCLCECGKTTITDSDKLKRGVTKSCGCLKRELASERMDVVIESCRQFEPSISSARTVWRGYCNADLEHDFTDCVGFDDFFRLSQMDCTYCNGQPGTKFNKFLAPSRDGSPKGKEEGTFIYNGLDRVQNELRHTLENVVPCCPPCNRGKAHRTLSEFLQWAERLVVKEFIPIDIILLPLPKHRDLMNSVKGIYRNHRKDTDLTIEEFFSISQMNCFYCNIEPSNAYKTLKARKQILVNGDYSGIYSYNGIDRVNSDLSHNKSNIVACCKWCNFAKGDLSLSDFQAWIRRITAHLAKEKIPLQALLLSSE